MYVTCFRTVQTANMHFVTFLVNHNEQLMESDWFGKNILISLK